MIHILTVHWDNPFWLQVQHRYLSKHIDAPFRIHSYVNGFDPSLAQSLHHRVECEPIKSHPDKLNRLAATASQEAADTDWLIFIDSDAFPIAPLVDYLTAKLNDYPLVAIRRDENHGDCQPHPSFCATTMGVWREIDGDWNRGHQWKNSKGELISDVGANVLAALETRQLPWFPMRRSNRSNLHPVFFGIYDDLVYHHGAGSRGALSRADNFKGLPMAERDAIIERNGQLSRQVLSQIADDEHFYQQFLSPD
ncbi:MAG: hypothetical protein K9L82_14580 [Chromatiaceae bacterium]|nr:hypothetical protein [Chromatiaceae bacterium]MCF7995295.1 hypothetical protein [Chromatiaceae bacterium]MCF8016511.1 hypothetical protein [Chromatiaceae bacterium]